MAAYSMTFRGRGRCEKTVLLESEAMRSFISRFEGCRVHPSCLSISLNPMWSFWLISSIASCESRQFDISTC